MCSDVLCLLNEINSNAVGRVSTVDNSRWQVYMIDGDLQIAKMDSVK